MAILWRLKRRCWWVRHRIDPRHRYHVVSTGLPPGYHDPDVRLTAAIFNETARYVERTKGVIDWSLHDEAWMAFSEAAAWWDVHRDVCGPDDEHWEEAKRHLHAVIEHLPCMWYP